MRWLKKLIKWCFALGLVGLAFLTNLFFGMFQENLKMDVRTAVTPDHIEDFQSAVQELWQKSKEQHLAAEIIIKKGDHVLFADASENDTLKTPSLIGSISKQFTAAKIFELVDEGKIGVDDKLCKYIDGYCKGELGQITIRHLLSHTAGLPSQANGTSGDATMKELVRRETLEGLVRPEGMVLNQTPGETFQYSNLGYTILSRVIEIVTKKPFSEAMNDFFKKNGLNSTYIKTPAPVPELTSLMNIRFWGGSRLFTVRIPSSLIVYDNYYGAGSVVSTAEDLSKWAQVIIQSGKAEHWLRDVPHEKHQHATTDRGSSFYYGGLVANTKNRSVWHNGAVLGYYSLLVTFPENGLTAVILYNSSTMSGDEQNVVDSWERLIGGHDYKVPVSTTN